jgi:hypothetical protein
MCNNNKGDFKSVLHLSSLAELERVDDSAKSYVSLELTFCYWLPEQQEQPWSEKEIVAFHLMRIRGFECCDYVLGSQVTVKGV